MPDRVKIGIACFGVSGLMLVGFSLASIFGSSENTLTDVGGLIGIVELVLVGRLPERRQWARLAAMSICLGQAAFGIFALIDGLVVAFPAIALAGLVIIPLSGRDADEFFEAAP